MRLFLIRHPPVAVAAGICYGATDLSLREPPEFCAERLRPQLPAGALVFTSPLRRCRELAAVLSESPRVDRRLTEMDFGAWEMRPWSDIPRHEIDAWAQAPLDYAPPGGESVAAVRHRVGAFLADCRAAQADEVIVVTHAGVMKLVAAILGDLPVERWLGLRFVPGEIYAVAE